MLPRETLDLLFEFNLRKLQMVDGLWFLGVEDRFGTEQATNIDYEVWHRIGISDARRARETFGISGDGIPALINALKMTWMAFVDWDMEQVSDSHAVFRAITCYPQKARVERGKGVFDCQPVEEAFFTAYAQTIDPRFRVYCGFCPRNRGNNDLWCEWHFRLVSPEKVKHR